MGAQFHPGLPPGAKGGGQYSTLDPRARRADLRLRQHGAALRQSAEQADCGWLRPYQWVRKTALREAGSFAHPVLQFTGKERDAETGLDYFGARYMSSVQGRFTSPDEPLVDQYAGDPQSWNLYSYVRNSPLRNIDPTGRTCVPNGNGGFQDVDGPGGTCADALKGDIAEAKKPSATVTAQAPPSPGLVALALGMRRAAPVVNAVGVGTGVVMAGAGAAVAYGVYAGGTGLLALGVAGGPAIFQAGQVIDRIYRTSGGPVRFVAEVAVEGSQLVLKEILVYPVETGRRIAIGAKEVLQAARPLLEQAKRDGYTSVRFIADRSVVLRKRQPGTTGGFREDSKVGVQQCRHQKCRWRRKGSECGSPKGSASRKFWPRCEPVEPTRSTQLGS
ncbi:MAG: RHS repeat-associated core domain-containing protein [Bryobacterales bacterium]|nr:RHS repeat-associated core domain-containing protein [Bryobacterales bacterium]